MTTPKQDAPLGSESPFDLLPDEMLGLIVERLNEERAMIWTCRYTFPNLKALRLTCRRFAFLPTLLEILFHGVRLIASLEHVELLENTDISVLDPYVKRVVFEPAQYSWTMTQDLFREIVVTQALHHYARKANLDFELNIDSGIGRYYHNSFILKYLDGKRPFSDAEIEEGFNDYMRDAIQLQRMFESRAMYQHWSKAISALRKVDMFRVGRWNFGDENILNSMTTDPGCRVIKHPHDEFHTPGKCRGVQEAVGEAVMEQALAALTTVKRSIKVLRIDYIADGDFNWASNSHISQTTLGSLETLLWQPHIAEIGEIYKWPQDRQRGVALRCGRAVDMILEQCGKRLKHLRLPDYGPLEWPLSENIDLPSLETIKVGGFSLYPREFAALLSKAKNVQKVHLFLTGMGYGSSAGWKVIWDTIRNHPKRMHLDFGQISANDCAEVTLHYHTAEEVTEDEDEDPWGDVSRSLSLYLAGKGEWNKCLRMWFEGEEEDESNGSDGEHGAG